MKKYKSKSALKHFIVTAIFAAMCQHGAAQTTEDIATGLNDPRGIHTIGANLYVAESGGNIISKINLDTKVKTAQFTGTADNFTNIRGLTSKGNDLYIAISGLFSISKIDVSNMSPALVDVLTSEDDLGTVESIVLKGNILYATNRNEGKIVKIDNITADPLVVSNLITGITVPRGLLLNGNDLYVTSGSATGKLSKINTDAATPAAMDVFTLHTPNYMVLDGNNLYISEIGVNKVVKIDISVPTLTKTDVLTGLTDLQGLAMHNGYLYVAQAGDVDKVVRSLVSSTIRPGSFTITMQGQIDDIDSNIVGIAEDLIISEATPGTITSLAGLANIVSIGGNLEIVGNTLLTSLEGLNDLVTLEGKLYIGVDSADGTTADANAALVNYCAISNLVTGTAEITRTDVAATNEYFVANNGYDPTYAQFGNAATCNNEYIHEGNLTLTTQGAITSMASGLTRIEGNLMVSEATGETITSLAGLENIVSVGGNLEIVGNASLTSLAGLEDLVTLEGKLYIGVDSDGTTANANAALVNYCAISNLVTGTGTGTSAVPAQITNVSGTTDEYFVVNNEYDPTYAQLGNAITCNNEYIHEGNLTLTTQTAITDMASGLTRIEGNLMVSEATARTITSLAGLENIVSVGGNLEIVGNALLTSLAGLEDLVTLEGKLYIGVDSTDGTTADANAALVNYCAISNLVTGTGTGASAVPAQITNVAGATNEYFVGNNGYNPSYVGLASADAATTTLLMDGCRKFGTAVASTNTFSKEEDYRLFPNPVKDILFVKSESEITSISIHTVSGQIVLKGNSGSINVQYLSKGIYFAKIVSGEKVVVEKFIKL